MAKKGFLLQSISAIIFAVMCFAFYQFVFPSDYFQKEQTGALFTMDSFIAYLDKPAWLACYGGNLLMSLCGPSGAPFLITVVLLLEWWILTLILKRFKIGEMAPLYAFLPVMLEWGAYCHPIYLLHSILSTVVGLSIFLGYTFIKNKWWCMFAGLMALPVIYILAGNRMNLFILLGLLYEAGKNTRRWLYWGVLLIAGIVLPGWMGDLYSLPEEQAYLYPHPGLPAFFPAILFCFSLFVLQMSKFRDMPVRIWPVTITTCFMLVLLVVSIYSFADF